MSIIEHYYCPCCKSTGLDRDDMAISNAAVIKWGQPICHACLDDHSITEDGVFMHHNDAVKDDGLYWSTAEAIDQRNAEAREDADLARLTAGWR